MSCVQALEGCCPTILGPPCHALPTPHTAAHAGHESSCVGQGGTIVSLGFTLRKQPLQFSLHSASQLVHLESFPGCRGTPRLSPLGFLLASLPTVSGAHLLGSFILLSHLSCLGVWTLPSRCPSSHKLRCVLPSKLCPSLAHISSPGSSGNSR